jgi:hypothetical protein
VESWILDFGFWILDSGKSLVAVIDSGKPETLIQDPKSS